MPRPLGGRAPSVPSVHPAPRLRPDSFAKGRTRPYRRWGPERVDAACASALEHEQVDVGLIGRMLERGTEHTTIQPSPPGTVIAGGFACEPGHFAVRSPERIVEDAFAAGAEDAQ